MFISFIFAFLFAEKITIKPFVTANKIEKDQPIWVALSAEIPNKKHIYGKFPGSSGLPTKVKFELPEGFRLEKIYWPIPDQIQENGEVFYAYKDQKTILAKVMPEKSFENAVFKVNISYLLCGGTCEPQTEEITIDVAKAETVSEKQFESWYKEIPKFEYRGDIKCVGGDKKIEIILHPVNVLEEINKIEFFAVNSETFDLIDQYSFISVPQGFKITLDLSGEWPLNKKIKGIIRLHKNDSVETFLVNQNVEAKKTWWHEIWLPILFALMGGFVLNFMPCVLPVISIKVIHLLDTKENMWRNVLMYTLGIINTFVFLAGLMILFRYLGQQVGWGFQMQSANVIYSLLLVFLFIALNFFDIFQINNIFFQSSRVQAISLTPYLNGILTAVVATPCTAPFMGTAIASALFQPLYVVMLIFFALGLGFASPVLLLPLFPWVLPKPGEWMVTFKYSMGFVILGTVAWFLNILGALAGIDVMTKITLILIATSFFVWLGHKVRSKVMKIISLMCVSLMMYMGYFVIESIKEPHLKYEMYNEVDLNNYLNKGENLLLFFTAKWCVTCQINHKILDSKNVVHKINEKKIRVIMFDWTSQSDDIAKLLYRFGKQSIPCTVLVTKDKKVQIFPELLTQAMLLGEIEKI